MGQEFIKNKSFDFAIRIVHLYKILIERKEFVMSKQMLRSGKSIGQIFEKQKMPRAKLILYTNWVFHKKKQTKLCIGLNFYM